MIAQIAVASVQQTSMANESSLALHSIYQLGSENLSAMSGSVASANTLSHSAVDLKQQIECFQVGDDQIAESELGYRHGRRPRQPRQHHLVPLLPALKTVVSG
jgi:hypothetical protein